MEPRDSLPARYHGWTCRVTLRPAADGVICGILFAGAGDGEWTSHPIPVQFRVRVGLRDGSAVAAEQSGWGCSVGGAFWRRDEFSVAMPPFAVGDVARCRIEFDS